MKFCLSFVLVTVFLCMYSTVFAEVREYGPDYARFTVDVPSGWTESKTDIGVKLDSPDNKNEISLQISKHNGSTAEQIANGLAKQTGLKNVEKIDDDVYNISGETDGVPLYATIAIEKDLFFLVVMAGELDVVKPVAQSMKVKN